MDNSTSKEKILKKIREALSNPVPLPFAKNEGTGNLFAAPEKELEVLFAEEFTRLSGRFAYCLEEADAYRQITALFHEKKMTKVFCAEPALNNVLGGHFTSYPNLATADAAITSCHCLVARTGSLVLSSHQPYGRTGSVYAPVHICIAYTSQLVFDTRDAIDYLKIKLGKLPSSITFAAGPSRTADIEKTLVVGVHGPKEVYVFLIDDTLQNFAPPL